MLAEDPATGKVEPEPVLAVIDDGIKPLMQVRMSDGSSLSVTTNHTFWGESGVGSGDHDFFVGTARVLVHNADGPCDLQYEESPKHHENAGPGIADAPINGQAALDNSVQVRSTSTRRVGVDPGSGQIVVFDETHPGQGIFHGHVRTWSELTQQMKNALQRAGLVDRRGRPIR